MENRNTKKRKLLLLILAGLIPVIALLFYNLINSQKDLGKDSSKTNQNAFNDKLPSANLTESGKNKLEIYMQAQQDSAKLKEQLEKDPYAKKWFDPTPPPDADISNDIPPSTKENKPNWNGISVDQNEKKVNDRLEKLYAALNNNTQSSKTNNGLFPDSNTPFQNNDDIEKFEKLLSNLKTTDTSADPEIKQMGDLLDKILDIQHPERVKERLTNTREITKKDTSHYTINTTASPSSDFFYNHDADSDNPFYGLQKSVSIDKTNTVMAVIHENQKIQDGQTIKFRLLQNIYVNNTLIPKGNFVFGKCSLSEGRANVYIQDIAYNNSVYPVQLTVYDQTDGIEGINVQGNVTEQVSKDGMDQLIQQMQLNSMTSSLGVQAATSGIQTAKNLLSKKIKKQTVTLKAGHVVLLQQKL